MNIGKISGGFRMIPDKLWMHPMVEFFDLGLWCALTFCARERATCSPTDAKLSGVLEVSVPTVQRGLRRLETASFISRSYDGDNRVITLKPEGDGQELTHELKIMRAG